MSGTIDINSFGRQSTTLTGKLLFPQIEDTKTKRAVKIAASILIIPVAVAVIADLGIMMGRLAIQGGKSLAGRVRRLFAPKVLTDDQKDFKALEKPVKNLVNTLKNLSQKSNQGKDFEKQRQDLDKMGGELHQIANRFLSRSVTNVDSLLSRYKQLRSEISKTVAKEAKNHLFIENRASSPLQQPKLKDQTEILLTKYFLPIVQNQFTQELNKQTDVDPFLNLIEKGFQEKLFDAKAVQALIPNVFRLGLQNGLKSAQRDVSHLLLLASQNNVINTSEIDLNKKLIGMFPVDQLISASQRDLEGGEYSTPQKILQKTNELLDSGLLSRKDESKYIAQLQMALPTDHSQQVEDELNKRLEGISVVAQRFSQELAQPFNFDRLNRSLNGYRDLLTASLEIMNENHHLLGLEIKNQLSEKIEGVFDEFNRNLGAFQSLANQMRMTKNDEILDLVKQCNELSNSLFPRLNIPNDIQASDSEMGSLQKKIDSITSLIDDNRVLFDANELKLLSGHERALRDQKKRLDAMIGQNKKPEETAPSTAPIEIKASKISGWYQWMRVISPL